MIEESKIRQRAYELWEEDACPEGSEQIYWRRAQEELETEGQSFDEDSVEPTSGGVENSITQSMALETKTKKTQRPKK